MRDGAREDRCDSVALARFLLSAAAANGADAHRLAREAELPSWMLAADTGILDVRHVTRIWELIEHAWGAEDAVFAVAAHYQVGALDLYDYLFATAPTLREGLARSQRYAHLVTTNSALVAVAEDDGTVSYAFRPQPAGNRRTDLAQRAAVLMCCARTRAATGRGIVPVRVGFAHPAPRSTRPLAGRLGTAAIDFGTKETSLTLRSEDLASPLRTADPVLADILVRYAESVPRPSVDWIEWFREVVAAVIDEGATCGIDEVARRLAVSARTLQRRLAERGTTWSAELEAIRYDRARRLGAVKNPTMSSLAAKLGYGDVRSVRRAMRRWKERPPTDSRY